jgi:hypothetical protein
VTVENQIEALRRRLLDLASQTDDELCERYELERPSMPPGIYWRMRWLAGWTLRWLEAKGLWRPDPWPVSLKQSRADADAKPLLIWAVGADPDVLRQTCKLIYGVQVAFPRFAPVLITDVADFAFFSRLGWLVEYLPALDGLGERYDERKLKYLARLYSGAPAIPVVAGVKPRCEADMRRWLQFAIAHQSTRSSHCAAALKP